MSCTTSTDSTFHKIDNTNIPRLNFLKNSDFKESIVAEKTSQTFSRQGDYLLSQVQYEAGISYAKRFMLAGMVASSIDITGIFLEIFNLRPSSMAIGPLLATGSVFFAYGLGNYRSFTFMRKTFTS